MNFEIWCKHKLLKIVEKAWSRWNFVLWYFSRKTFWLIGNFRLAIIFSCYSFEVEKLLFRSYQIIFGWPRVKKTDGNCMWPLLELHRTVWFPYISLYNETLFVIAGLSEVVVNFYVIMSETSETIFSKKFINK